MWQPPPFMEERIDDMGRIPPSRPPRLPLPPLLYPDVNGPTRVFTTTETPNKYSAGTLIAALEDFTVKCRAEKPSYEDHRKYRFQEIVATCKSDEEIYKEWINFDFPLFGLTERILDIIIEQHTLERFNEV